MRKRFLFVVGVAICFLTVQFGFVGVSNAQWGSNSIRDLFGENHGDFIALQWDDVDGAAQYYVYTSTALAGPWTLAGSLRDNLGGSKIHQTPDARLMDLCYKVEATDAAGAIVRVYQPICVPKYAGKG